MLHYTHIAAQRRHATSVLEPPEIETVPAIDTSVVETRSHVRAPVTVALLVALSLGLRLFALDWGMPSYYDRATGPNNPYRHSYHIDEDNFLWGLALMRPSEGNFDVKTYHWGTLQFYLIYGALLTSEVVGFIPTPWEDAFNRGDGEILPRLYLAGRVVSVLFGVACTLVVWALGRAAAGQRAALFAGLAYAVAPLAAVEAHYLTNDITMSALLSGAILASVHAVRRERVGWLVAAGLLFGLAVSAKYSAAFGAPGLLAAQWLVWRSRKARDARAAAGVFLLPPLGAAAGFLLGEPYALILPDAVLEGLRAANRGNGIDLGMGLGPPARMLGLHSLHLGGLGLTWPLALLSLAGLALMAAALVWRFRRRLGAQLSSAAFAPTFIILAAAGGLTLSLAANRIFMLRYSQPLVPFLAVAAGVAWAAVPHRGVRWAAGTLALGVAGVVTLGQLSLMAGPHPADEMAVWLEGRLRPGQQVAHLWLEYPVIDGERYNLLRIDPWYPDLPPDTRPDYIIMDDMQLGPASPGLQALLGRGYREAARFGARPSILGFSWDEGSTPHDWKYSHPTFTIFERKQ